MNVEPNLSVPVVMKPMVKVTYIKFAEKDSEDNHSIAIINTHGTRETIYSKFDIVAKTMYAMLKQNTTITIKTKRYADGLCYVSSFEKVA